MRVHDIPVAAVDWQPYPPGGRVDAGQRFTWGDIQGFRQEDGLLIPRESIRLLSDVGINIPDPVQVIPVEEVTGERQRQAPRLVIDLNSGGVVPELVLVTNRDLFYLRNDEWRLLTPVYDEGTVNVTNGSTTVTGNGTLWFQSGISDDSRITITQGGTDFTYRILRAGGNTDLELTEPWQGGTEAGLDYSINRSWSIAENDFETPFFAKFHNGDLYVAGSLVKHTGYFYGGAVIRCPNLGGGTAAREYDPDGGPTPPVVEYLTAGDVEATPTLDQLDEWIYIVGMDVLQDGKVILLTHWRSAIDTNPTVTKVFGTARIYHSDFDQTVWTSPPAGFFDIVNHDQAATGLGRLGEAYTIHFADGVNLAYPTGARGEFQEPLEVQETASTHGTVSAMALKQVDNTEVFPCADGTVRIFDGRGTRIVADSVRDELGQRSGTVLRRCLGAYDGMRNRYRVFLPAKSTNNLSTSLEDPTLTEVVEIDLDTGATSRLTFPAVITGVEDLPVEANYNPSWTRALGSSIVGIWNALYPTDGETTFLAALADWMGEDDTQFVSPETIQSHGALYLETNPIDFGEPGVTHLVDHVTVWLKKSRSRKRAERWRADNLGYSVFDFLEQRFVASLDLPNKASTPRTYHAVSAVTFNPSTTVEDEVPVHLYFPQVSAETVKLILRPALEDSTGFSRRMVCEISRLQIHEVPLHPIEALRDVSRDVSHTVTALPPSPQGVP